MSVDGDVKLPSPLAAPPPPPPPHFAITLQQHTQHPAAPPHYSSPAHPLPPRSQYAAPARPPHPPPPPPLPPHHHHHHHPYHHHADDARAPSNVAARTSRPSSIETSTAQRQSPSTPLPPYDRPEPGPPRMPGPPPEPWGQPPPVPPQSQQLLLHHHHPGPTDVMHEVQYQSYHHHQQQQQQQQQQDPYAPRRYGMPQHDPQTPIAQYMHHPIDTPFTPFSQEPEATTLRRKAVRAAQACENCRQKKSKCDEQRPECQSCLQSNLKCQYREVPPPKQEKSMQQVTDLLQAVLAKVESIDARTSRLEEAQHYRILPSASPSTALPLQSPANGLRSPATAPSWTYATPNGIVYKQEADDLKHPSSANAVQVVNSVSTDTGQHDLHNKPVLEEPKRNDTQAHNLLWCWDSIRPFVQGVLRNSDEDYVLAAEESRGILKVYGAAPGPDRHRAFDAASAVDSPAAYSDFSEHSNSSLVDSWGFASSRPCNFTPPDQPSDVLPGGLHARTGHLQLDRQTFDRLYESYTRHLHVLHPFINKERVQQTIDRIFALPQSLSTLSEPSSSFDARRDAGVGQKRKRPDHDLGSNDRASPRQTQAQTPPLSGPLERSPDVAILLLICALGRVCEENGNLDVSGASVVEQMGVAESGAPSPLAPRFASPAGATTPRSASFPSAGVGGGSASSKDRRHRMPSNIDTHPGLAYYAEAKEIIGNLTGSHSMSYVHANLLAGLYMAQFVRILESYRAIHEACISCIILIHQLGFKKNPEKLDNYARLTYWSCLQMESDILAELSFPRSGITQYEEDVPAPAMGDEKVMVCYSAQITLRKILNQSTWYLYDGNTPMLNNPTRSLESLAQMSAWLEGWRTATASTAVSHGITDLAWDDDDEPATDINIARIRGKYYGAKYIIHRPFLKHILHQERRNAMTPMAQTYGNPQAGMAIKTEEYQTMVRHAQTCVNAALKSTYAFDGYRDRNGRLLVTNIFGTAHAQFGNSLVLAATYLSPQFGWMVDKIPLDALLSRTIDFFRPLARLSPTMTNDLRILYNVKRQLLTEDERRATAHHHRSEPASANHSFQGSMPSSLNRSFPP